MRCEGRCHKRVAISGDAGARVGLELGLSGDDGEEVGWLQVPLEVRGGLDGVLEEGTPVVLGSEVLLGSRNHLIIMKVFIRYYK